jgi:hypothetical protein
MTTSSGSTLVYSGPLVTAQRVWSALRGHGLDARLLDQTVGNLYGTGGVLVTVRQEELGRARELLVALGLVTAPTTEVP